MVSGDKKLNKNLCKNKKLTNGQQIHQGSCSETIQGEIPSVNKMPSTLIIEPINGQILKSRQSFRVKTKISNLITGFFTNPNEKYYTEPQQLKNGVIKGHSHVTIQKLDGNNLPNAKDFTFFKGLDQPDKNGILLVKVKGLSPGDYRICTLVSSFSHQPVIMPVAKRGSQDDCSYQCRVGWATDDSPRLQFDNLVSKFRDRKINKSVLFVGNDVYTDATAKASAKSPFDGNVVYNFETMEYILDYIFVKLGIDTDQVYNPILMTEPVCNPNYSRKMMNELLFECYRIPSVCYGIDALFSFHANGLSFDEGGVVISSGHTSTHVIPIIGGHAVSEHIKRISYGVAQDYFQELNEYTDPKSFAEKDQVIQFPYVPPSNEKTEEELTRAEERKQEQARRLKEQATKLRMQKVLKNRMSDETELDDIIQKTEKAVQRARNKLLGIDEVEIKEEPTFQLVDIPDDQLNEVERKEKKKQLAAKSLYESRQRQREAKELAKKQQEAEERMEEDRRQKDFDGWLEEVKKNYEKQLEKVKTLKRKKEQLSDRRSHASQLRMKSIANLASDAPQQKKKRRGQDGKIREDDAWEEEEELTQLREYETKLLQYDKTFSQENTYDVKNSNQKSLIFMFTHGVSPPYDPEDFAQMHQLHLNIEQIRVPEALFQPSILGLDQAGLVETVGDISVFVTGGHTQTPGLITRLEYSLQSILPTTTNLSVKPLLKIIHAQNPVLDAWHGAALWARSEEFKNFVVTEKEYLECGGEYIKEHCF
ncbi:21341_t:CDS:10, partial [Entrophospora sp. SA101]